MVIFGDNVSFRELWRNYRSELPFFLILSACIVAGHFFSRYIPLDFFNTTLTIVQNTATASVCLVGAFLCFRHAAGLCARRLWAWTMLLWGLAESFFLIQTFILNTPVLLLGFGNLSAYEMLAGNFLGWLLLVYPTEALRPGWLNFRRAAVHLFPMVALVLLDYVVPADLRVLIALYPGVLTILICVHIHAYRIWCEDNYSSLDNIDALWVVRYLIMMFVLGVSYIYICVSNSPTRAFTQNVLIFFMFAYSTEQILFRKDPWSSVRKDESPSTEENATDETEQPTNADIQKLEDWMTTQKPYLNPDFQLMDLRAVLPMNRTYLSRFIHDAYNLSFYQFVNRYRIEEAKRLKLENPKRTIEEIAAQSGFASRISFTRTFTNETGESPSEWYKKCNNS